MSDPTPEEKRLFAQARDQALKFIKRPDVACAIVILVGVDSGKSVLATATGHDPFDGDVQRMRDYFMGVLRGVMGRISGVRDPDVVFRVPEDS